MMYRTCTVQTNLDFSSEADMVKKLRVSLALQPVGTALFANSPFTEGKPNGFLSFRSEIWRDTDPARSGMLPWAFEPGMGFERWVDYALDVPMYFVKRGERYIDVAGQSFRDLMAGKLPALPGERATISDWANHLSTIFPEVRLKRYLEMRGSDSGPRRRLPALPAYWVGILYDDACLDAAWDLVKHWTAEERQKLRDDVPKLGFKAEIRGITVRELARQTLALAREGLTRRRPQGPGRPRRDAVSRAARGIRRARHHAGGRAAARNSTVRGTARSSRSSANMLIEALRDSHGRVMPRRSLTTPMGTPKRSMVAMVSPSSEWSQFICVGEMKKSASSQSSAQTRRGFSLVSFSKDSRSPQTATE